MFGIKAFACSIAAILALGQYTPAQAQERSVAVEGELAVNIEVSDTTMSIRAKLPEATKALVLTFHSDRNDKIARFTDVSPHNPKPERTSFDWELWYPVVDIMPTPGLEGVLSFDLASDGVFSFNGKFHPRQALVSEAVIPANQLEHWANELVIEPKDNAVADFSLRRTFQSPATNFYHTEALLTQDWAGRVTISAISEAGGESRAVAQVVYKPEALAQPAYADPLDLQRLSQALDGVVGYTLRSRNLNPASPTDGGGFLIYDFDARAYFKPDWIWPNGIAMKMLLGASELGGLSADHSPVLLRDAAHKMGEMSLEWAVDDPAHPAYALTTSRYKVNAAGFGETDGFVEYINPADALFLAGYGWMPIYEATGDTAFLDATQVMVRQTRKLVEGFELVPMDYVEGSGWTDQTLNEHGFGMLGISELYRVTKDRQVYDIGIAYIDQVIGKLGRDDGLWHRAWDRKTGGVEIFNDRNLSNVKGQGWAMIGLMAAADMAPDGPYLGHARKMADVIIAAQLPEGHWANQYFYSEEEFGASEKGTAIWSYMLYQLYAKTGEEKYLVSARKALQWLLDRQYWGEDPNARGGIYERNANSGIVFRKWYPVTVTYTASFFGAALVEELKLRKGAQE
jgi:hypothetical protein